jgi:hypothetical protein
MAIEKFGTGWLSSPYLLWLRVKQFFPTAIDLIATPLWRFRWYFFINRLPRLRQEYWVVTSRLSVLDQL